MYRLEFEMRAEKQEWLGNSANEIVFPKFFCDLFSAMTAMKEPFS